MMRIVIVPPSKSLSNRALLLALYHPLVLRNILKSDDTNVMLEVLPQLGVTVKVLEETAISLDVQCSPGKLQTDCDLFVGNAGTATRFLAAALSFFPGEYRLHGTERMHERPITGLIDGLKQLGAEIEYEGREGCLPIRIIGKELQREDRSCIVAQNISSQYVSGLLLSAPFWPGRTFFERRGILVSQSYVDLTARLLEHFGLNVDSLIVSGVQKMTSDFYRVEGDWSSASYWLARAAVSNEPILLEGMSLDSLQGDKGFLDVLVSAGFKCEETAEGLLVEGDGVLHFPFMINCVDFPDAAMTLAVLIAVSGQTVELTGLANLRVKECDRLSALSIELGKVGIVAEERPDGLLIIGKLPTDLKPASICTYNDHRVAMCFAILQLLQPGIVIENPECVSKTYPTFWEDWD